jgi:23S rRNA pseudouridine2457 synthase
MYYIALYKPYGVLSQFTREAEGQVTLANLSYRFPKEVYPIGRLDKDSEGLLLLTDDKSLNADLLHPDNHAKKTYFVQVEGVPTPQALAKMSSGMTIRLNDRLHTTLPAQVKILAKEPLLPERNPPVRFRQNIPTTWLSIKLVEGKNHQIRKMTAGVGFPTLRLVRYALEAITIENMEVGEVKKWATKADLLSALKNKI